MVVVLAALMVVAVAVPGSPWRNDDGGFLPESPLLSSIVFIVFVLFVVPGIVYGFVAGSLRSAADVPKVIGAGHQGHVVVHRAGLHARPVHRAVQLVGDRLGDRGRRRPRVWSRSG